MAPKRSNHPGTRQTAWKAGYNEATGKFEPDSLGGLDAYAAVACVPRDDTVTVHDQAGTCSPHGERSLSEATGQDAG